MVIKARVPELASKMRMSSTNAWFQQDLERSLLAIPHRTYLWLYLTMEVIGRRRWQLTAGLTRSRIEEVIISIPASVADAYIAILNKGTDGYRARRLLQIMIAATRALTVEEMNVALAVEPGMRSKSELDIESEEEFKYTVRNLCGLLVKIVDNNIHLIHQTAKIFLLLNNSGESVPHGL